MTDKIIGYALSVMVGLWAYGLWKVGREAVVIGWLMFWIIRIYWKVFN